MRKACALFLFTVFLSASGSAVQLDSGIYKDSCPNGYEPVISMADPDKSYNNPAPPSIYKHKVCVSGITETTFGDECRSTPAFYLSSNTTHAHFSESRGYNLEVCAGRMITEVRDQCLTDEIALFSVSDRIEGFGRHVANVTGQNPDIFSNVVCGFYSAPENVSLSMKFNLSGSDEVYFDDEHRESEFNYSGLADFPYIVSTSGTHTAGIVSTSFRLVERRLEDKNILTMKKEADDASFFVPFTEGGYESIEDSQQEFLESGFLNTVDPSFNYQSGTNTVVRAMIDTEIDIRSNLSISRGNFQVKIEKTGEDQVTIQTE